MDFRYDEHDCLTIRTSEGLFNFFIDKIDDQDKFQNVMVDYLEGKGWNIH